MRAAVLVAITLAGCSVTHPREAPGAARRWPEVRSVLVIPGTVTLETKNFLGDDFFRDERRGAELSRFLANGAWRAIARAKGARAVQTTGSPDLWGPIEVAEVADDLLAHAREWAARDPDYASPILTAPGAPLVPPALLGWFDAVVVVGGRTRLETERERYVRYRNSVVRNLWGYPLIAASVLLPVALPFSISTVAGRPGNWATAPDQTYLELAVYDGRTGELLYHNDWFEVSRLTRREEYVDAAAELLRPLLEHDRARGREAPPEGSS